MACLTDAWALRDAIPCAAPGWRWALVDAVRLHLQLTCEAGYLKLCGDGRYAFMPFLDDNLTRSALSTGSAAARRERSQSILEREPMIDTVTCFVVLPFTRDEGGDLVPLEPTECRIPHGAIRQAAIMAEAKGGAVCFSRTGDPASGDFADAVVVGRYGDVPDDLTELA